MDATCVKTISLDSLRQNETLRNRRLPSPSQQVEPARGASIFLPIRSRSPLLSRRAARSPRSCRRIRLKGAGKVLAAGMLAASVPDGAIFPCGKLDVSSKPIQLEHVAPGVPSAASNACRPARQRRGNMGARARAQYRLVEELTKLYRGGEHGVCSPERPVAPQRQLGSASHADHYCASRRGAWWLARQRHVGAGKVLASGKYSRIANPASRKFADWTPLPGRENIYLNGSSVHMSAEITRKSDEIVDFAGNARAPPVKRYSSGMSARLVCMAHLEPETRCRW